MTATNCSECGAELAGDDRFCSDCGAAVPAGPQAETSSTVPAGETQQSLADVFAPYWVGGLKTVGKWALNYGVAMGLCGFLLYTGERATGAISWFVLGAIGGAGIGIIVIGFAAIVDFLRFLAGNTDNPAARVLQKPWRYNWFERAVFVLFLLPFAYALFEHKTIDLCVAGARINGDIAVEAWRGYQSRHPILAGLRSWTSSESPEDELRTLATDGFNEEWKTGPECYVGVVALYSRYDELVAEIISTWESEEL